MTSPVSAASSLFDGPNRPTPAARAALQLIVTYQRATAKLPSPCRFHPSCSNYAAHAVHRYGLRKGVDLASRRLLRCGPWAPGGYDPVP